jgi:DNA repair exonuclease SbcCD ATPase subunit
MILLRLKADGFGCLRGEYRFARDRMTVVLDDNERGKSTMVAAIQAALYGLDADRRRERVLTPLDRYRPWDGGSYRVELDVEFGGETYTLKRDFTAGRAEVRDSRGLDVTEQFRQGKEDFPVGQKLLRLSEEEFEKCALLRQGELDAVTPADERRGREATLHARLEGAVDTRKGDTNASEALAALTEALDRYTSPDLDSTLKVDNAIKRLEDKKGLLETDLRALEEDFRAIAAEAARLTSLDERDRTLQDGLTRHSHHRDLARVADWKRQLVEHEKNVAEWEKLRQEAASLEAVARLPRNAEAELREAVASYQQAQANADRMGASRSEEKKRARVTLETELASVSRYKDLPAEEADRCVAWAADLKRLNDEDRRLREDTFRSRERLASRGFDPERIQYLNRRFAQVSSDEQALLRDQAGMSLHLQTEIADLERVRTECSEELRAIDQMRASGKVPAWVLLALGGAVLVAGGVVLAMRGATSVWGALLGGGGALALIGTILLARAGQARSAERGEALKRLAQAQHRLTLIKEQRARSEMALDEMAARLGVRDRVDLLREWTEYSRLMEENEPAIKAQERAAGIHEARRKVIEEARVLLARAGGGEPDEASLDRAAQGIRRAQAALVKLKELESEDPWAAEQQRAVELADGFRERALGLLKSVGLSFDQAHDWAWHLERVTHRLKDTERHQVLIGEIIPRLEKQLLSPDRVRGLKAQLDAAPRELLDSQEAVGGTHMEHERSLDETRKELDEVQKEHRKLRDLIGTRYDQYYERRPALMDEIQRLGHAVDRARRFQEAVELARDTLQKVAGETHKDWTGFLNQRVGQLLSRVGTQVPQIRFGEDLDFSVQLANGQQIPRQRAELQLSAGARDQLYLATRVAVSEYLSRGQVKLPLLLDDPLTSSDDERARAVVGLLAEDLGTTHQILLFSCHRARFMALAARDPERFAKRIQMVDARGVVQAARS